ncbi:MAG: MerR family transcriptional regulator [Pasteurellaceae bacterium]|nr:MerR family transcriptional regulator [Pasteurellaceae bacterium]
MKIGEFAKNCHISIRMVRFYEQLNLIKPTRTQNGYRYYSERHIDEVKKIRILNQVGIPLKDIALLQNCLQNNVQTICPLLREKLQ